MGVQEFATHVLNNKDEYTPTLVKRANFAKNSKKFKHAKGGLIKKCQEGEILDNQQMYTAGYSEPVTVTASKKLTKRQQMQADEEWRQYLQEHPIEIGSDEYNRLPEKAKAQVYKNSVTNAIDKAALPTAAAIIAPTAIAAGGAALAGSSVAPAVANTANKIYNAYSITTTPQTISQGVSQISNGNYVSGASNLVMGGLNLIGLGKSSKFITGGNAVKQGVRQGVNYTSDTLKNTITEGMSYALNEDPI